MNKKQTQQRKQLWKQVLSILLAVTLVVTSLYLPADAAAVEELSEGTTVTEDVTDDTLMEGEESTAGEMEDASETEDTEDSFIDRLADALGIEESENETSEAAAGEAQFSGLEADGLPVEQLKTDEIPEEEVAPEAMILSEVEEEREEDSKTFLMSDGNFQDACSE